jgi:16S rRNA (cytidine1402-2'-O)-methyltransferase
VRIFHYLPYLPLILLSIVSTPIGNLGDISERAKEALQKCDAVVCEDTRVTGKLLHLLGLPKKELISFNAFNERSKLTALISQLKAGKHLALVSDAGTPGISDPGFILVRAARGAGIPIEVIPGPAAFLAALSISGLPTHHFTYLGFLPKKKGRKTLLESLKGKEETVVFYESPHRIEKTLLELADILKEEPEREVTICRELTKKFEEVTSTTVGELREVVKGLKVKGESVVVLGGKR